MRESKESVAFPERSESKRSQRKQDPMSQIFDIIMEELNAAVKGMLSDLPLGQFGGGEGVGGGSPSISIPLPAPP